MIIWINGSFGSGKTTLSKALKEHIPNSIIYDPEQIGCIIHRTVPESREIDFQNFSMWRRLAVEFAKEFEIQFNKNLIVPMTLIVPEYQNEIFKSLAASKNGFYHFYLDIQEKLLRERISNQKDMSEKTNKWRLDQVDRCLKAKATMPKDTIFIDSGKLLPEALVAEVKNYIK